MTESEQKDVPEAPQEPKPEKKPDEAAARRAERAAASLRERIAREAEDEVTVAFDTYGELRQSIQSATQAVEKALQQCASLEKKCGSHLGRRLFLKPALGVLGTALHHLKKVGVQMDAASRLKADVLEEAVNPGLDH